MQSNFFNQQNAMLTNATMTLTYYYDKDILLHFLFFKLTI